MAASVSVNITNHPLSREENGIDFQVDIDGLKFGELRISKGGVRWKPRNKQDHHFLSWKELDAFMKEQPKR